MLLRPKFNRRTPHRGAERCVVSPGDDWSLLEAAHANTLVVGPREATRAFLLTINPWLRAPVRRLACEGVLTLPAAAGTLVLEDVDVLSDSEQLALLHWLEITQTAPQLISVTTSPLYDQVEAGTFLQPLYYRLNMLHLQVQPA